MSALQLWVVVIVASIGCIVVKAVGYLIPASWLAHPRVQRVSVYLPIVLLAALVATQTVTERHRLLIDHRAAGVAATMLLLAARRSFLTAVVGGAGVSALIWHLAAGH
jgi:branched-subunit amino acid transport protein